MENSYTMKDVKRAASKVILEPVLDFLQKKNPSREYVVKTSSYTDDSLAFSERIMTIRERVSRLLGILSRKIARVSYVKYITGKEKTECVTYDDSTISQNQLETLMKGVDIGRKHFGSASLEVKAVDYD